MKNMKKIAYLLICLILFACSSNPNSTLNHSPEEVKNNIIVDKDYGKGNKDIVVFSTNDTLSAFNDNLGFAGIKYYIDHFDKRENFTTFVDVGNFSAGTEIAEKSKGKSSIEIMNMMGYDIIVPGSYEFSYGMDTFYENMKAIKATVVCCNIYDIKKGEIPFTPYVIYQYGNLKVAFVGVTSPEALLLSETHDYFYDENNEQLIYLFEDEDGEALYKQVQSAVDAAKSEGADKVILLAHLGIEGITEKWSSTRVIANTKDIDAVIDGHSMEVLDNGLMINKVGKFIPLVQAGSKCKYVGAINISKENYINQAVLKERSVNTKDERIQKEIDKVLEKYSK